jgi:kynurenine formamidase
MIIDLSHSIRPGMPVYPGDPDTTFVRHAHYDRGGCLVHAVTLSTHAGTHLDAPAHWLRNGAPVDSPSILAACAGPARVLDVTRTSEPGLIAPRDLGVTDGGVPELCIHNSGCRCVIGEGDRILLASGWSERFGCAAYFEEFPSVSVELAAILAERRIALLGVETPSLHVSRDEEVHTLLLSAGVVIVENLANLTRIAGRTVFFAAAPLALEGLDGSPVRAFAVI